MQLNEAAFSEFKNSAEGNWDRAKSASEYRKFYAANWEQPFNRMTLQAFCDQGESLPHCAMAVMAWGGARANSAKGFWEARGHWADALSEIRHSEINRAQAYAKLQHLRPSQLPGAGPAYFTKLLWFLRPKKDAYIMDQWTARSVNALFVDEQPLIHLIRSGQTTFRVSDQNHSVIYETFCKRLEFIANMIDGMDNEMCEKRMFGQGGRGANVTKWRRYLMENPPRKS